MQLLLVAKHDDGSEWYAATKLTYDNMNDVPREILIEHLNMMIYSHMRHDKKDHHANPPIYYLGLDPNPLNRRGT